MQIPQRVTKAGLLLAALFSLTASAHQHTAPATSPPANCEISGVVTDAATGQPLAGAQVMVLTPPSGVIAGVVPVVLVGSPCDHCDIFGSLRFETLTDARGRFTIRKVVPGQYMVRALARGYAGQYYQVQERYLIPNAFFLRAGQKRNNIRIQLPRQVVLAGRVLDEHGQPVISAYVQLMQYGPAAAKQKSLQRLTAAVTDDRGEYRLFGLLPGRYYIQARYQPGFDLSPFRPSDVAERFLLPRVSLKTFSPSFYYPGVTAPSEAKPIEVGPGQVLSGLDISVRPLTPAESAKLYPERFKSPPAGDCQVSGVVTNAATGQPIDHAWVFLGPAYGAMQPPNSMSSTDADGRFDFHGISCASAPQPLLAWKNGFVGTYHRAAVNVYPPGTKNPFPPQPSITHVNLSLIPAGVITGRITDAHGKPAACVRVALIPPSYVPSRRWLNPSRETVTDDRGRYRFYQLAAGRYYVAAQIQPSSAVATQTTATFPAAATPASGAMFASPYVYYPGAADVGNATEVRVAPGEEVKEIDFSVKPETTYSISGIVKGPALLAVKRGLRVVLTPAHGIYGLPFPVHESPLDVSGIFRIDGVTPGTYILWATALLGTEQYAAWAPVTIEHANVTGVALDPHPGWTITGHLTVEGQPHGKSLLYQISAQQQDEPLVAGSASARDVPPGGSFELKGVFPGHYLIRVDAWPAVRVRLFREGPLRPVHRPSNMYIKSVKLGAQDVQTNSFEVPLQGPAGTLDLTVDWHGAQVEGTVVNSRGEPAGSADVVLLPENRSHLAWWQIKTAQPYLHGRFLIVALPPGQYRLFAWQDANGAWIDPDFLNSQWKKGMILDLSEGETKSVNLRVLAVPVPPVRRNR